jgi:hypothetical protein
MQRTRPIKLESISKILRKENRSNDLFEIMLSNLTIEEMITLKLELVSKTVGINLYGLPLWKSLPYIVKDAILRYAMCVSPSKVKAVQFLGMDKKDFKKLINKYDILKKENKDANNGGTS